MKYCSANRGSRNSDFNVILIQIVNFIQINHQPDATVFHFIILTFIYSSKCFGRFPAHHQELNDCSGSLWFYLRIVVIVVLCSWSGQINHQPDATIFQFIILLFTAQHVSGVFLPIIRSSMTALAASGFTFVSW